MQVQVVQEQSNTPLWDAFREGRSEAFSELYHLHVQALFTYGKRFTPDTELVEDCIQDTFIDLWRKRASLGDTDSPKHYLLKSLRNRLLRRLSRQHRFRTGGLSDEYAFEMEVSPEGHFIHAETESGQQGRLQHALGQLTRRQREAIYLKFYENLSYAEIAALMGVAVPSVYNLVSKAIDLVRQHLGAACALLLLAAGLADAAFRF